MTYEEQLSCSEWKTKRSQIISNHKNKCQICLNKSFHEKFEIGFIFSNHFKLGFSTNLDGRLSVHIYDFKNNSKEFTFLNYHNFDYSTNYICYFKPGKKYNQIVALRKIESEQVELRRNILAIVELGIRGLISDSFFLKLHEFDKSMQDWIVLQGLQVHHTFYQKNLFAWEYPDESLQTLCWDCHENLHKDSTVPFLDEFGNKIDDLIVCDRCFGAGVFPEYHHVQSGKCFKCNGKRFSNI